MGGGVSKRKGKAAATAVIFKNAISGSRQFFDADALLASIDSGAIALGLLLLRQALGPGSA